MSVRPVKVRCFFFLHLNASAPVTFMCMLVSCAGIHCSSITCQQWVIWPIRPWYQNLVSWMGGIKTGQSTGPLPFFLTQAMLNSLRSSIFFFTLLYLGACSQANSFFLIDINFLFTCHATNLNCERSSVNFFKTSSICFASSLVGVIIMAPTWWRWKRERLDTKKIHNPALFFRQVHCPALPALQAPSPKFIYWWWV